MKKRDREKKEKAETKVMEEAKKEKKVKEDKKNEKKEEKEMGKVNNLSLVPATGSASPDILLPGHMRWVAVEARASLDSEEEGGDTPHRLDRVNWVQAGPRGGVRTPGPARRGNRVHQMQAESRGEEVTGKRVKAKEEVKAGARVVKISGTSDLK